MDKEVKEEPTYQDGLGKLVEKMKKTKMRVYEQYASISGEAGIIPIGKRTIFFRTGGCNLNCTWCDTPHTINPVGTPMTSSLEQADELVKLMYKTGIRQLLITGGEPLMQQMELLDIIEYLFYNFDRDELVIQMETNGSLIPVDALKDVVDCFVYDIKPPSSEYQDTHHSMLDEVVRPTDVIKCVIVEEDDLAYYLHEDQAWIFDVNCLVTFSVNQETAKAVAPFVDSLVGDGYAMNCQMHKIIEMR